MKNINWRIAPYWANYAWVGLSGRWFFGYKKPSWSLFGYWQEDKKAKWEAADQLAVPVVLEWNRKYLKASLQERPNV